MPELKDVKVNLDELKTKIASQKKELHEKQIAMGAKEGAMVKSNKRSFLNELVHSMRTGQNSEAIKVVQAVNETVENKKGVPQAVAKNLNSGRRYAPPRQRYINEEVVVHNAPKTGADDWGMGGSNVSIPHGYGGNPEDRFDQAFSQTNEAFDRMMMSNNPMYANNPKYQKLMESHPSSQPQYIVEQPQSQLTEQIEQMNNNIEKLVESNLKSVLTNIYTKQKIQEGLVELLQSKDGLDILSKAINEIVKRNKAKQVK